MVYTDPVSDPEHLSLSPALRQDSPLLVSLRGSVDASVSDPGTKTLWNQRRGKVSQLFFPPLLLRTQRRRRSEDGWFRLTLKTHGRSRSITRAILKFVLVPLILGSEQGPRSPSRYICQLPTPRSAFGHRRRGKPCMYYPVPHKFSLY